MEWYVANTKPRCEEIVCTDLRDKDIEVFAPRMEVVRTRGRFRGMCLELVFPGYIFVRIELGSNSWYRLRWTPGVRKILGYGGTPSPVPEEVIGLLRKRMKKKGFIRPKAMFVKGERVQIKDGPLKGLVGVIEEARPGKERVKILMNMLRDSTKVEINISALEKASNI